MSRFWLLNEKQTSHSEAKLPENCGILLLFLLCSLLRALEPATRQQLHTPHPHTALQRHAHSFTSRLNRANSSLAFSKLSSATRARSPTSKNLPGSKESSWHVLQAGGRGGEGADLPPQGFGFFAVLLLGFVGFGYFRAVTRGNCC